MKVILLELCLILSVVIISCEKKVDKPLEKKTRKSIFDNAYLLTTQQEDSLTQLIEALEKEIGSQVAIITIDSLPGQNIETFSFRTFGKLRLGRAEFDDGLLITVAVYNREMRIEVGYGLEKIIRDEIASRINREEMAPSFREDDYYGGLMKAVRRIKKLIEENKALVGQRL